VALAQWAGRHRPDRKICGSVRLRSLNATLPTTGLNSPWHAGSRRPALLLRSLHGRTRGHEEPEQGGRDDARDHRSI